MQWTALGMFEVGKARRSEQEHGDRAEDSSEMRASRPTQALALGRHRRAWTENGPSDRFTVVFRPQWRTTFRGERSGQSRLQGRCRVGRAPAWTRGAAAGPAAWAFGGHPETRAVF